MEMNSIYDLILGFCLVTSSGKLRYCCGTELLLWAQGVELVVIFCCWCYCAHEIYVNQVLQGILEYFARFFASRVRIKECSLRSYLFRYLVITHSINLRVVFCFLSWLNYCTRGDERRCMSLLQLFLCSSLCARTLSYAWANCFEIALQYLQQNDQ
jgi:hypothetical protein